MITHEVLKTNHAPLAAWRRNSVAIVGMDGSGKSTQARLLCAELRGRGKHVVAIHPFGRKLLVFVPERLAGHESEDERLRSQAEKRWRPTGGVQRIFAVMELMDIGLYIWLAYIWAFLLSLVVSLTSRGEVWLISDRSFDDLLIKHRRRGALSAKTLRRARRLTPVAEETIWLKTPPGVAMARDGEFDASYYEELYAGYEFAAKEYGWVILPTTDRSMEQVRAEVESVLLLAAPPARRETVSVQETPAAGELQRAETQVLETRQL